MPRPEIEGSPLAQLIVPQVLRGGVVLGAVLARELDAELDVVLGRRSVAVQPGAGPRRRRRGRVGLTLIRKPRQYLDGFEDYLAEEVRLQKDEIRRRRNLLRGDRPPPNLAGRSVIVTDDGVATGSTMIAALKVLAEQHAHEVLVAVPVGSPDRLAELRNLCDDVVCLLAPPNFRAIGLYYADFHPVEDAEAAALLAAHTAAGNVPGRQNTGSP